MKDMAYPTFWKLLDGSTNTKDSYPYPQKEIEEPESLLGHWWATEMDSLWWYHSNFSDGVWQRNYKVANVRSPSTVHSE